MKKTIGKNTLGDGKKMQIAFNNYERSNHNLSYVWRNTQAPGTLVPFMKVLAMPGDTFDIELESHILTHPTVGPLFGSYKFQADVFVCPIRLYNALLHNNALNIGLNMSKVKFPKFNLDMTLNTPIQNTNPSSLLNYLGIKSKGKELAASGTGADQKMNAIPAIAYYDIFKNFYANKQEEKFYVLGQDQQYILKNPNELTSDYNLRYKREDSASTVLINDNTFANKTWGSGRNVYLYIKTASDIKTDDFYIEYKINNNTERSAIRSALFDEGVIDGDYKRYKWKGLNDIPASQLVQIVALKTDDTYLKIEEYELKDIDDTREEILTLGETEGQITPTGSNKAGNLTKAYLKNLIGFDGARLLSSAKQYGLALKTYQSDIFNNWIKTDWIDGENGINAITAVDVSDGKLELDTLILAKKVYNMLNRIAVSGGTYNDWIETVYTTNYINRSETPEYQGGMSAEIQFQEVISNSATENEPLGTLAGRGTQTNKKGGKITVKITEPAYIIGICSITPRVDYSQGNDFDIMLDNLDQVHKPALDAIGFQDLVTWKMDADSTRWNNGILLEYSVGKQPAWIDYMTNFNRTHGNFAVGQSEEFMVLNRIYQTTEKDGIPKLNNSTYIDPSAYNYVFADTDLAAMNFWIQMGVEMKARRVMSAKMMPTL